MKSLQSWLSEYGESHQNHTNKRIHWICVPAIFFSIFGMLYSVKLPITISGRLLPLIFVLFTLLLLYYARISRSIALGMLIIGIICTILCIAINRISPFPLWQVCLLLFVLAWIGQFYGHKVEGKKPSFLKDLQFLLIGPAWLMSFIYKRLGIGL
ncbi:MAG: DUF962 domain-containing protein [Chitinophagaceae bacterium]|nr:DUF962 domain-containing protein [Bacteroidota bacterium]MCC6257140.1 DUF962 domain-containing protein [Chitinophagaceae bacterium]MCW5917212.1 DUF962 domain-containing protein [Ferruginibacter sp.]